MQSSFISSVYAKTKLMMEKNLRKLGPGTGEKGVAGLVRVAGSMQPPYAELASTPGECSLRSQAVCKCSHLKLQVLQPPVPDPVAHVVFVPSRPQKNHDCLEISKKC